MHPELERIAREDLGFETLETRGRDSLDFRSVAVWTVRSALEEAFTLGAASAAVQPRAPLAPEAQENRIR